MATQQWWTRPRVDAVGFAVIAAVAVGGLAVGYLSVEHARLAVVVLLGLAGAAIVARRPVWLAVIAVPATYVVRRLGSGQGIGYTDVILAAAAALALPALRSTPSLRTLRGATRALAVYLVLLLPSIIATPQRRGIYEWGHRAVLVGGALLVGAWLVREGRVQVALRLLLAVGVFFAIGAAVDSVTSGFKPAFPFGFHKNFVGSMLATTVIVAVAGAAAHRIRGRLLSLILVVLSLGLVATQSRGGMLAAGGGLLVWAFRSGFTHRGRHGWRVLAGLAAVGFTVYAGYSVSQELQDKLNANTNSLGVRQQVETYTRQLWRTSPATGIGMKYFNTGQYGVLAQPANNVVDNELAESGVIGLVGFAVLQGGVLVALWRRRDPLAIMGLAAVSSRLLHGMFDIYWTAGTTSLPFIIAGIGLAASRDPHLAALARKQQRATGESTAPAEREPLPVT